MSKLFIVANWKANKTESEVIKWIERFKIEDLRFTNKEVILCPSFCHLATLKSCILNQKSLLRLGAQDISQFESGAYTGEVYGGQIKEFADYVIINHSERRKYFGENDELASKKVEMAEKYNLSPIFCVQEENSFIPTSVEIVAYEPVFAIGTGEPDTPENANSIAGKIKEKGVKYILYGGSVTPENIKDFTSQENINGILVGGASLDLLKFSEIIKNA